MFTSQVYNNRNPNKTQREPIHSFYTLKRNLKINFHVCQENIIKLLLQNKLAIYNFVYSRLFKKLKDNIENNNSLYIQYTHTYTSHKFNFVSVIKYVLQMHLYKEVSNL